MSVSYEDFENVSRALRVFTRTANNIRLTCPDRSRRLPTPLFGSGVQRTFITGAIIPSTALGCDKPSNAPMRGNFEECQAVHISHARLGRGRGRSI